MFKRFSFKKKTRRDIRFLDAEVYRAQRKPVCPGLPKNANKYTDLPRPVLGQYSNSDLDTSGYSNVGQSLFRDRSGNPLRINQEPEDFIKVESDIDLFIDKIFPKDKVLPKDKVVPSDIDHPIKVAEDSLSKGQLESNKVDLFDVFIQELNDDVIGKDRVADAHSSSDQSVGAPSYQENKSTRQESKLTEGSTVEGRAPRERFKRDFVGPNYLCRHSLGIFCDSKAYSAMIKQELSSYHLDVRHFNHPNTFEVSRYDFFDRISAWIVFLSDDCDETFIERFLERYSEKPTLFLCPKTSRRTTTERVEAFIHSCALEEEIDLSDSELELS